MHIQFWGAAQEVTGSCFLIEVAGRQILIDCGLVQGRPVDELRNRKPFPFVPAKIDAVILSHAHLDHAGRLPLLIKEGFKGPVYAHTATRDLSQIMLKDAAYINEKEAEWSNRKRERKNLPLIEPLYSIRDAATAVRHIRTLDYNQTLELFPGLRLQLRDAGHILGSSIIELWLAENGLQRKLVFSGDLGHVGAPILHNPQAITEADLVIMESTYGDRAHRSWEATWLELAEVLAEALQTSSNILIPSFAVGRTQELLYILGQRYHEWNVDQWTIFLDSPLAIEATEVYARHADVYDPEARRAWKSSGNPFMLQNLHLSRTSHQSMAINRIQSGAIIIAGSGMCEGGRIRHHLKHNIWRRNCHVIIIGYQSPGTLGRTLVDGAHYIRLWGETIKVNAKIHTIGGLSAHADQPGLLEWYKNFSRRPPIALVHGEQGVIHAFKQKLETEFQTKVSTPSFGQRMDLSNLKLVALSL